MQKNQAAYDKWSSYPVFEGEYVANGMAATVDEEKPVAVTLQDIRCQIVNRSVIESPDLHADRMIIKAKANEEGQFWYYKVHPWQVKKLALWQIERAHQYVTEACKEPPHLQTVIIGPTPWRTPLSWLFKS